MVLNPEVQAAAQAQLDSVLGGRRLPEFRDRDSLPFIEAIIMETMRWHPVAGLGIYHMSSRFEDFAGANLLLLRYSS